MAEAMTDYLGWIQDAEKAVRELEEYEAREKELALAAGKLEKQLKTAKKSLADEIDSTIKKRRQELEKSYDTEIEKLKSRQRDAKARREKARSQGMKERISEETKPVREEILDLEGRLKTLYKAHHVPAFCRTGLFNALYQPRSFGEILGLLCCLAIFFGAVPLGAWWFLTKHQTLALVLIYLADIVVFGGLYLLVNAATKGTHGETLKEGRALRSRIQAARRQVKKITKSIRGDKDDSAYDLAVYDDEISRLGQELSEVTGKKADALSTFESVQKNIITDEITEGKREKIEKLQADYDAAAGRLSYTSDAVKDRKVKVAADYESYLGKDLLTSEKIQALREILDSGEASGIQEAAELLRKKDQK